MLLKKYTLILFICSLCFTAYSQQPKRPISELTSKEWTADLHSLYDSLHTYHLNLFHYTSENVFKARVKSIERQIPRLKYYEIFLKFKQLIALAGDGHSFIRMPEGYHKYPLEFFAFDDDVRLIKCAPEYQQALGMKLTAIDGKPIKQIRDSLNTIAPLDESSLDKINDETKQLTVPEYLLAFHLIKKLSSAGFEFSDGQKHIRLRIASYDKDAKVVWVWAYKKLPLFAQIQNNANYTPITCQPVNRSAYYINFQGYPSWEDMKKICDAAHDSLLQMPLVSKIVIDMRLNGGGNFNKGLKVMLPMLKSVKQARPKLRFYVITGRATFSAGMSNTVHFRDSLNAVLVGEPTGAKPNGYQENKMFMLPNSRVNVSCSQLFYTFQKINTNGVQPDKYIKPSFINYMKGKDPAIDWILAQ